MWWIILVLSGLCEAIWATALSEAEGFTKLKPSLVFLIFNVLSLLGLAYAMQEIPLGTAYAVWTGIGVGSTSLLAILRGKESAQIQKILLIGLLVTAVVGLKIFS